MPALGTLSVQIRVQMAKAAIDADRAIAWIALFLA
jgi:hypothetical protein